MTKILFVFFLLIACVGNASEMCRLCTPQPQTLSPQRCGPRAFEKIYVCPYQIMSDCRGIFYINNCGQAIKVRALLYDCRGMYVILF